MTIVALQMVNLFAPATIEEQIGSALCTRSFMHAIQTLGQVGLGLSYNSCAAAVAIQIGGPYEHLNVGIHNFAIIFGSSRLYQGLDPSFNAIHAHIAPARPFSSSFLEEHAEQTAIRIAIAEGQPFFVYNGNHHIYVDLTPCPNCHNWLQNRPENWYVHYLANLNNQAPVVNKKRKMRANAFGRQMEPRPKKSVKR